jgi:hypothetical protein
MPVGDGPHVPDSTGDGLPPAGTGGGLQNAQPAANPLSGDNIDANVEASSHQAGASARNDASDAALSAGAIAASGSQPVARLSLPKDALKLLKFKGDNDIDTLEDFLFQLELYFEALPGTYDLTVQPHALRHRLFIVAGCFPPASVAAVWFRAHYTSNKFTSYAVFRELFIGQFARHVASIVRLQDRWESAAQRRNQNSQEYYAYLLQLQSRIASVDWQQRPADHILLTKFCSSARVDLRRFLQEKRIDHPDYTISQLVQAASIRESSCRSPGPGLNAFEGAVPNSDPNKKYCYFCKKNSHNAAECRKIAAKKKRGEWQERPRPQKP